MGPNGWIARAARFESVQRTETSRELMDDAVALVGKWNAEHRAAEGLPVRRRRREAAAVLAAHRRGAPRSEAVAALAVPGLSAARRVDLRAVVRPADYPIAGLYDALTCTFGPCRGDGPRPVMLGLFASRADPAA